MAPLRPAHLQSQDLVASQVLTGQARPGDLEGTLHVSSWGSSAHPGFRTACTPPRRPGQVLLSPPLHPPGQPPARQAHSGARGRSRSPGLVTGLSLSAVHTGPAPRGSALSLPLFIPDTTSPFSLSPFPRPRLGSLPHWKLPPPQDRSQALTLLPTGPTFPPGSASPGDGLASPADKSRRC